MFKCFDKGPWCAGVNSVDNRVYVQSDDFRHDARLYIDGDFRTKQETLKYAEALAKFLNKGE